MKLSIQAGATSQSVNIFVNDSSSTTGAGLSGLVFNTAGLTAYYALPRAAPVAITLATLAAATTAYSSGGFFELDATHTKGLYRFDIPNAAIASGNGRFVTIYLYGATNMAPVVLEIELTGWDNQDATAGGISRIDAAISSRMATYTQPTGFLAVTFPSGTVASTTNITAGVITTVTTLTNAPLDSSGTTTLLARISSSITISGGKVAATMGSGDYTGNTVQTGDGFGRIGAAGAGLTALGDTRIGNLDAAITSRSKAADFNGTIGGQLNDGSARVTLQQLHLNNTGGAEPAFLIETSGSSGPPDALQITKNGVPQILNTNITKFGGVGVTISASGNYPLVAISEISIGSSTYTPAKSGDQMDLIDAPNAAAVAAITGGVWNALKATYNAAGSFGAWLQSLPASITLLISPVKTTIGAGQIVSGPIKAYVGATMPPLVFTPQDQDGNPIAMIGPVKLVVYYPNSGTPGHEALLPSGEITGALSNANQTVTVQVAAATHAAAGVCAYALWDTGSSVDRPLAQSDYEIETIGPVPP